MKEHNRDCSGRNKAVGRKKEWQTGWWAFVKMTDVGLFFVFTNLKHKADWPHTNHTNMLIRFSHICTLRHSQTGVHSPLSIRPTPTNSTSHMLTLHVLFFLPSFHTPGHTCAHTNRAEGGVSRITHNTIGLAFCHTHTYTALMATLRQIKIRS